MSLKQRSVSYNVKVDIHELQDCRFYEANSKSAVVPNPYVEVDVCGQKQTTSTAQKVSSITFNAQFNFTVNLPTDALALSRVELSAHHAYMLSSEIIGVVVLSLSNVYVRPQHWIYRRWLCLRHPERPDPPAGYLLVTVGVFGPGDTIPVVDEMLAIGAVTEVGRLTKGPDIKFEAYSLSVTIHRGQDITPFVRFGGFKECTKVMSSGYPDWNCVIKLPAFFPSYEDDVLIELWSNDGSPYLMGIAQLDFHWLLKEAQSPTWLNFYWRPPKTGVLDTLGALIYQSPAADSRTLEPTEFAGRVLVSATSQKTQHPSPPTVHAAIPAAEPRLEEFLALIDIYQITNVAGDIGRIYCEICFGPQHLMTPSIDFSGGSYPCDDIIGRLDMLKLYLPPLPQVYDIFLYVMGHGFQSTAVLTPTASAETRLAFARVPLSQCIGFTSKPAWYLLKSIASGFEAFSICATLYVGQAKQAPVERPPRLTYELKNFLFRAMIYEGINMPCISSDAFSTTFVKAELGGRSVTTRSVQHVLNPGWYEAFETDVALPKNLSLAPDIVIEAFAHTETLLGGIVSLGYFNIPVTRIPLIWDKYPEWHKLKSGRYSDFVEYNKGRILCSFELVPANLDTDKDYPFFDDIRPTTHLGSVHLFLVGIRLFRELQRPTITICYARDYENTNNPLWCKNFGPPRNGYGGNWNYLAEIQFDIELPKHHIHNAELEIKIMDTVKGLGGETQYLIGSSFIHLTPLLPWLSENEKAAATDTLKTYTLEEVLLEAADVAAGSSLLTTANVVSTRVHGNKVTTFSTIPYNDPEAANTQSYEMDDYLADLGETTALAGQFTGNNGQLPTKLFKSHDSLLLPHQPDTLNFNLTLPDEEGVDDERRDEISHELEAEVGTEDLPYHSIPIVRSNKSGVPETIGRLKYMCVVYSENERETKREEFRSALLRVMDQYAQTRDLTLRVYALSARGLIPPSGATDPSVYLWVRNAAGTIQGPGGLSHNLRDTAGARKQGYRPEFNKCYVLHCSIPDHAIVSISVMSAGGLADELIGTTHIDMEDRWFNPRYQQMMSEDNVPIEQRTIKLEGKTMSQGSLRLWIEMMSSETALSRPLAILANPDPEKFQLRAVIWKAKDVPMEDNASISFFVRGLFQLDNGQMVSQDTDTHFNSRDGSGRFNWRFVWNITLPSQYPNIKLQIFHSYVLNITDPIAECDVNLTYDFAAARTMRASSGHNIPVHWYRCTHPEYPGQTRGLIKMEASILQAKEADFTPVGKGRSPPNRNPYLQPVTEHRTYVDWKNVSEQFTAAAGSILASTKYGMIFIVQQSGMHNREGQEYEVLFTHQKAKRQKIWKDGYLVCKKSHGLVKGYLFFLKNDGSCKDLLEEFQLEADVKLYVGMEFESPRYLIQLDKDMKKRDVCSNSENTYVKGCLPPRRMETALKAGFSSQHLNVARQLHSADEIYSCTQYLSTRNKHQPNNHKFTPGQITKNAAVWHLTNPIMLCGCWRQAFQNNAK